MGALKECPSGRVRLTRCVPCDGRDPPPAWDNVMLQLGSLVTALAAWALRKVSSSMMEVSAPESKRSCAVGPPVVGPRCVVTKWRAAVRGTSPEVVMVYGYVISKDSVQLNKHIGSEMWLRRLKCKNWFIL